MEQARANRGDSVCGAAAHWCGSFDHTNPACGLSLHRSSLPDASRFVVSGGLNQLQAPQIVEVYDSQDPAVGVNHDDAGYAAFLHEGERFAS
jgi:hypothetical protein